MNIMQPQKQAVFFDPSPDRSFPQYPPRPTDDEVRAMLESPTCPFNQLVLSEANQKALHPLKLFAFNAYLEHNHCCRGMNFGIYCGPGQGKTHIVKTWAETIGIPFVGIQSYQIQSTIQLFHQIAKELDEAGYPLVPQTSDDHFVVPPTIVFFDEAHALPKKMRTGGLLNAMEYNDGWLIASAGPNKRTSYKVDCHNICWVAATTDPGILVKESSAFYDRFTTHIVLQRATKKDLEQIVKVHFPHFPQRACELVAYYQQNPRRAVAFAKQLDLEKRMSCDSWEGSAAKVAEANQIDQFGMSYQQVEILKALGKGPIAKNRLIIPARCRIEELEALILPPMLDEDGDRGPLIMATHKGFALTRAGLKELEKRHLTHKGSEVLAERFI